MVPAAVHGEVVAGDIARGIAEQERHHARDFARLADAAQRHFRGEPLDEGRIVALDGPDLGTGRARGC